MFIDDTSAFYFQTSKGAVLSEENIPSYANCDHWGESGVK